jgi:hypothetical protein
VFVLAESNLNPTVCGHTIPFAELHSVANIHRCPICHHPVSYIADGVSASMLASVGDKKTPNTQNATQLVYIKYGKLACHLSVPHPCNNSSSLQGWNDWLVNFFSWSIRGSVSPVTAQKRIAFALGISLQQLKVLNSFFCRRSNPSNSL